MASDPTHTDSDGFQDPGEVGIAAVTVWLYEDVDRDGTIDDGVLTSPSRTALPTRTHARQLGG